MAWFCELRTAACDLRALQGRLRPTNLVGPRPVVLTETELISLRKLYGANQIRPGLTGWAQINGRDEVSVMRKAILDREYKTRISFFFDLRIFLETFGNVLGEKGIHEGQRS